MKKPSVSAWDKLCAPVSDCVQTLPSPERGIVVAVSGGADSMVLLRALVALNEGKSPLLVAHLNHCLRGPESDADEEFVRNQASHLGLPYETFRIDVRKLAEEAKENLEATARRVRYSWLMKIARQHEITYLATGHNANDQAETILHRLLRGSGFRGLRGISQSRALAPDCTVIRPLLSIPRVEIVAALEEIQQTYREDLSNADLQFTRNRIRHELLPLLMDNYNPALISTLAQLAKQADELFRREEVEVARLLRVAELPKAGSQVILDRSVLMKETCGLLRALFRHLWEREAWPVGAMSFAHWERMAMMVLGEGSRIDLPEGMQICRRGGVVQVGPSKA